MQNCVAILQSKKKSMDGFFFWQSPLLAFFLSPTGQVLIFFFADNSFLLGLFPSTGSGNVFLSLSCQELLSHGGRVSNMQKCEAILQYLGKSTEGFSQVVRRHGAPLVPRERYEPNRRRAERRWRRGMGGRISRGVGW